MSSARENIDNGEGSYSSAAAANPPSAPIPPKGEAHLKSRKNLPRLIMSILEYEEEIARISQRLRNLPIQRELAFNKFKDPSSPDPVEFDPSDNTHIGTIKAHYNVTAMLVFCTGRQLKDNEVCCGVKKCMRGIFPLSIVPAEEDDEQMTSNKACANCQYDGMGSKCPLQNSPKEVKKNNDGEDHAVAEEDDMEGQEVQGQEEEDDSDDSDYVP